MQYTCSSSQAVVHTSLFGSYNENIMQRPGGSIHKNASRDLNYDTSMMDRVTRCVDQIDGYKLTTSRRDRALEMMVSKGNHLQMAELFRLVNYYNLPRSMCWALAWRAALNIWRFPENMQKVRKNPSLSKAIHPDLAVGSRSSDHPIEIWMLQ